MRHYTEKLSAYLHHELPKEERQTIAEHLLQCESCRKEHDEIKFGANLANTFYSFDAPSAVWQGIEKNLDGQGKPVSVHSNQFFNPRFLITATASILMILGVSSAVYFAFLRESPINSVENKSPQFDFTGWSIVRISESDQIVNGNEKLKIGETLVTDRNSKARIKVADIGQVEIAPNSRVRLVNTSENEHRLSLEKGVLQAQILAPPRLFVVDTPSAVAVDLGCAYTLEVDDFGNSELHVTSGFVALEHDGRESIVPAGAMAITKKGKGIGTPFAEDATVEFRNALYQFDFENGGNKALKTVLEKPNIKTSLTLWHLLSRVSENEREQVFNNLVAVVKLPKGVTKDGILRLDKGMLTVWRLTIEGKWFENYYGSKLS